MNTRTILSYKDWLMETKDSASLKTPYEDYLEYVNLWYDETFNGKSTEELTSDEYTEFILTLKVASLDPEINKFIENLDYTNSDEVETAIPFLAKTLRDNARYISKKRDESKNTVENYSMANSNLGLSNNIYRSIVETFIGTSTLSNEEIAKLLDGTTVNIEELYDDNIYHDKSPDSVASDYFDVDTNAKFYSSCDPKYMNWAIGSGFNDICSNNEIFNPQLPNILPLSGYIDYTEGSEQTTHFKGNLSVNTMGEEQLFLSGDSGDYASSIGVYSDVVNPWDNLSNIYYPTIAVLPLIDSIYSKDDVGGYMLPSKLGMPMAIGKNKYHKPTNILIDGDKVNFPDPSIYSNGYSFTNKYQDAPIGYRSYLNWIDIRQSSGVGSGILSNTSKYQEMTPYQTSEESTGIPYLGLNQTSDKTDPWYLSKDKKWEDNENFPPDFRNIYDIDAWYSTILGLSGYEDQWAIDIYGNNYALYKDTDNASLADRRHDASGVLYVRNLNGRIMTYRDFFESSLVGSGSLNGFEIDKLRSFNIYNDIIVLEDINGTVAIQTVVLEDGEYKILSESSIITLELETTVNMTPLDHCFDDRSNILYLGRTIATVDGFVEFMIYKYESGDISLIFDTRLDKSPDILKLRTNFDLDTLLDFPIMRIAPNRNLLYVVYTAMGADGVYVVSIPLILSGELTVSEIVVVTPNPVGAPISDQYAVESRYLLDIMLSENLTIILEGSGTKNKYLQVIPL